MNCEAPCFETRSFGALLSMRRGYDASAAREEASGGEAEVQHVAVLDDVVLAFESELAGIARARFAIERDVIVVGDCLGAYEALLEIGVDDARRLLRPRASRHGPGASLLGPGGEIGDETEHLVALADQPVEPGLGQPKLGEISVTLRGRKLGKLGLDLGRGDDAARA